MKFCKHSLLTLFLAVVFSAGALQASEIGFYFGGYSRDSDISEIQSLAGTGAWTKGDRSFATYLGGGWAHKFLVPLLELEHTVGLALGADESSRPNTFVYSTNLHLIFPVALLRVKPFLGGGIGYVYDFGEKSEFKDIAGFLGNTGNFQFNIGGGTKIKLSETWWMRITLRDYILISYKQAIKQEVTTIVANGDLFSTVDNSTHNLSITASLAYSY